MKLNSREFKRFQELQGLIKSGKASSAEKNEYDALLAKKNERGSNDIKWWKNYPNLLSDVVNIPFNWIPGTRVKLTDKGGADTLQLGLLAVAKFYPTIGKCIGESDAFNAQMRQLWLDMHRKYRGIGTYEKSDLGIAIIAINSAYTVLAKFERMYGVINSYHIGNRVVPKGLKEALGVTSDIEDHLADFRYKLNFYIEKMKQLCLPKGLSILEADLINVSNVFKDAQDKRAFLFMFDTEAFFVYDPSTLSTGGSVISYPFDDHMTGVTDDNNSGFTMNDIDTILSMTVDTLLQDDDIARMCSDLLAAYGADNVNILGSIPENYIIEPVCDYERSLQFHNLTIAGGVATIFAHDDVVNVTQAESYRNNNNLLVIYQKDNQVQCRIGCGTGAYTAGTTHYPTFSANRTERPKILECVLDCWTEQPGETEVMCGTRFTSLAGLETLVTTNVYRQELEYFGTAVVTTVVMWSLDNSNVYSQDSFSGSVVDATRMSSLYFNYMKFMQMDWHPIFYVDDTSDLELFGDVDNFTIINGNNLQRIHDVALFSGFHIPCVSTGKDK